MLFSTTRRLSRALGFLLTLVLVSGVLFACASAGAEGSGGAKLDTGAVVNTKMKSLAAGEEVKYYTKSEHIKAVRMAEALPTGFVPTEANTVSAADSAWPVYIFFDNKGDAGIMYVYTEGGRIVLNPDSAMLFANHTALTDISGIAGWDSSRAEYLYGLFMCDTNLPDALALRNWDTSSAIDMRFLFYRANSLMFVDVSNWDTSKVRSMECMFAVGDSWKANGQLREIIGLEHMDVSNVTDMTCMFYGAAQMTFYDIGGWNVSKVESMNHMFCDNRELRQLDLSKWDVSSLKTVYAMFDDNVKLVTIGDVSHWNTVNLIDAGGWLNDCSVFTGDNTGKMDLSGWDTRNLKCTGEMFYLTKIHTLDLSGWTFDAMTNETWEGTGRGIYYETGNMSEEFKGFGGMFMYTKNLKVVYVSQAGLDSFNAAVERGVYAETMWDHTKLDHFTVK